MKRWCAVILVCAAAWPARGDEPEIVDVYSRGDDTGVIYRGEVTAGSLDGVSSALNDHAATICFVYPNLVCNESFQQSHHPGYDDDFQIIKCVELQCSIHADL